MESSFDNHRQISKNTKEKLKLIISVFVAYIVGNHHQIRQIKTNQNRNILTIVGESFCC